MSIARWSDICDIDFSGNGIISRSGGVLRQTFSVPHSPYYIVCVYHNTVSWLIAFL